MFDPILPEVPQKVRLSRTAERWRRRWAVSFGGNLLAIALVVWYALYRLAFN